MKQHRKSAVIDWIVIGTCLPILAFMIWGGMPAHHTTAAEMARNPAISGW